MVLSRKVLEIFALWVLSVLVAVPARATVIEGYTPSGKFKTVGVTDDGRFQVLGATSVAQTVIFPSSQPVNAFQGTVPYIVAPSTPEGMPVKMSVTNTPVSAQVAISSSVDTTVLGVDPLRRSSLVCNQTGGGIVTYLGPPGVTSATGLLLDDGACYSPDMPTIFQGHLNAISTAPARIGTLTLSQ